MTPQPRTIVSLWDMLDFNAERFLRVTRLLGALQFTLEAFKPAMAATEQGAMLSGIQGDLDAYRSDLMSMEMPVTRAALDRVVEEFNRPAPWCTAQRISDSIKHLTTVLGDELKSRSFLGLSSAEAELYSPATPFFGVEFDANFPSALYDLDEAGKCRGLGRSTACVFHLMRIMEIGVRATARCLGIPEPTKPADRNWGMVLRAIKAEVDHRWPQASRSSGDGYVFERLYASLDAVRNPFRNSTMHVEDKYTDEEARHIWAVVDGFMRRLSARCDESGLPLA